MRNEYDHLKWKFFEWAYLKQTMADHYNSETNTFNLTNEEWEDFLKDHPRAKNLRSFHFFSLTYALNYMREHLPVVRFDGTISSNVQSLTFYQYLMFVQIFHYPSLKLLTVKKMELRTPLLTKLQNPNHLNLKIRIAAV